MSITIFSATGCTRCKIAKKFLAEKGLAFEEKDIKEAGKQDFNVFYRENRPRIFRGPDGVEFPIYYDGESIRQGLGPVIGHVQSDGGLTPFFSPGVLHGEWVDGIYVSRGNAELADDFVATLGYLKSQGMKLELVSDGRNPDLLARLADEGLGDRLFIDLVAPKELYAQVLGCPVDPQDVEATMALAGKFPEYVFRALVSPVLDGEGKPAYLSPAQLAEMAAWLKAVTGNIKEPFVITAVDPSGTGEDQFKGLGKLEAKDLFLHRSKARAHQVMTSIAQ